jgi:hypothetical protein
LRQAIGDSANQGEQNPHSQRPVHLDLYSTA